MVVPYGFGVGDFVAVGTLAWNVYKSCRAAPGSFSNISTEVLSLHAVLKEADETIFRSPLSPESQARLRTIGDGCQCVLGDLQALVDKYESLGTQSRRTWDRMKWGAEDIVEIRSRLTSNATMLTAFIRWAPFLSKYLYSPLMQLPLSTSQTSVEQKLDKLISDFQQGKRAPSVVSLQTVDSLDPDDKEAWRTIRKELEDIGISVAALDANKDFIFEWLSNAVDTGAFLEQALSSPSGSVHSLDVLASTSSSSSSRFQKSNQTVTSDTEPPKARRATTKSIRNHNIVQAEQASNGNGTAADPHAPVIPTKVPRVAALIATLSRPKRRLVNAVREDDVYSIKKILTNPATSRLIDRLVLSAAIRSAVTWSTSRETYALLIDAGADINDGSYWGHPLINAVLNGRKDLISLFLDRGADVNYQTGNGRRDSSALRIAISRHDEAMITFLAQRGADINAVQELFYPSPQSQYLYQYQYPTAIHQASAEISASVVDLLINLGADLTYSQEGFGTPLMLAIYTQRHATAEVLIRRGANVNEVPGPLGNSKKLFRSAIHIAIQLYSSELVKLLLNNGAVTDWHEAYEFAEQQKNVMQSRIANAASWTRNQRDDEAGRNATAIMKLIKEKMKQESVVQS